MSGGGGPGERQLDHTPTWAVALVCFVIIVISVMMDDLIHNLGEVIFIFIFHFLFLNYLLLNLLLRVVVVSTEAKESFV